MYSNKSSNAEINPIETGIIVCTIEKANALVLRLLDEENLGMLSCLIVDELHMVRAATASSSVCLGRATPHALCWQQRA